VVAFFFEQAHHYFNRKVKYSTKVVRGSTSAFLSRYNALCGRARFHERIFVSLQSALWSCEVPRAHFCLVTTRSVVALFFEQAHHYFSDILLQGEGQ
jgi:hypothetical protein